MSKEIKENIKAYYIGSDIDKVLDYIQQKENIIREVREMLYKRDKDDYDIYTANVLCDIQSDFEEILRGEY